MWLHGLIPTSGPDPKRVQHETKKTVNGDAASTSIEGDEWITELKCEKCTALESITNFPNLKTLTINKCPKFQKVEDLRELHKLIIFNCDLVSSVEGCPMLRTIMLVNCPNIKLVTGVNETMTVVYISDCPKLERIETPKDIERIDIRFTSVLKLGLGVSVGTMILNTTDFELDGGSTNIKKLSLNGTTKVTRIENIHGLEELTCMECLYLESISNLDSLQELYCEICPGLATITHLPSLNKLNLHICGDQTVDGVVHVTECPALSNVIVEPNVEIKGWGWEKPMRTFSQRNKYKTRSNAPPPNPIVDPIAERELVVELCTRLEDIVAIISQLRSEHEEDYFFVQNADYYIGMCETQAASTVAPIYRLYIARIEGAPSNLKTLFGEERCVLPAFICTAIDHKGNVHVTDLWISKHIRGANVAHRFILALKPKYYNVALDDAAKAFWDSTNYLSEEDYFKPGKLVKL